MIERTGITAEELAEWQAATDRASPGPWEYRPEDDEGFARICTPSLYRFVDIAPDEPETRNDAQFIILAREAMPRLLAEMDAILFAAHMPADYQYGLPSWINQKLYVRLISLLDRDGQVIRRADDVEALWALRKQLKEAQVEVERLRRDAAPWLEFVEAQKRDAVKLPCDDPRWCALAATIERLQQQLAAANENATKAWAEVENLRELLTEARLLVCPVDGCAALAVRLRKENGGD